jgi:hypothetical protein
LLEDTMRRADAAKGNERKALRAEAVELAGHMVEQWPAARWYPRSEAEPGNAAAMLTLLARLGAAPAIEAFVVRATAGGDYGRGDNEALLKALACLPPKRQSALLAPIVEKGAAEAFGPCAALLALVAADRTLAVRAAAHLLAWPKTYDLDCVLIPALRTLKHIDAAIQPLRAACLANLRVRVAEPLASPADWRRADRVPCKCEYCAALSKFLADPGQRTWVLRAAEYHRGHVEGTIRSINADVDTRTDRQGRPYSLVCT